MSNGSDCSWPDEWGGQKARGVVTQLYFWLALFVAVLSMAGSLTIVALYVRVKDIRSPGRRLLVFLSMSDFLTAAGNLFGLCWFADRTALSSDWPSPFTDVACRVQAAWSTFSSISSFSWSVVIAVNVFVAAVRGSDYVTRRLAVLSHLFCWGMGATIVTITASQDQFGYDQCTIYWCWVRREYGGSGGSDYNGSQTFIWQLVTGKAYELITVASTVVLFALSWRRLRKQPDRAIERNNSNRDVDSTYKYASRKLLFVPLVFIISRIFGIVRFAMNVVNTNNSFKTDPKSWWIASEYMAPLQGMGDSSQGLLNCLVFIFTTRAIRQLMRNRLPRWMLPRQNSETQLTSERSSLIGAMQPQSRGAIAFS